MVEIFTIVVLLFSLVLHEVSHGLMALSLGDNTAKNEGRLSLNPLKHLDPIGSVLVPLFLFLATAGRGPIFGWAKPVPVNPYNLNDQKWGMLKVALAGPLANFSLAVLFAFLIRSSFLPNPWSSLLEIVVLYNLLFGLFNLMPFPPLDGSNILFSLLPQRWERIKIFLYQYGQILLLFFIFFGLRFLNILVFAAYRLLLGY